MTVHLYSVLDDAQHTETEHSNAEGLGQNGYVPSTSMSEDKIPLPPDEPKHEKLNKPLDCAHPLKTFEGPLQS